MVTLLASLSDHGTTATRTDEKIGKQQIFEISKTKTRNVWKHTFGIVFCTNHTKNVVKRGRIGMAMRLLSWSQRSFWSLWSSFGFEFMRNTYTVYTGSLFWLWSCHGTFKKLYRLKIRPTNILAGKRLQFPVTIVLLHKLKILLGYCWFMWV